MIIDDLSHWHVHAADASDVRAAIDIHQRSGVPFCDAMIVNSAKELSGQALYSEDLNPGQAYEGVRVRNPFQVELPALTARGRRPRRPACPPGPGVCRAR